MDPQRLGHLLADGEHRIERAHRLLEDHADAGAADAAFDLGLVGTWTWQPNRIGLIWFLEEVVPRLSDDVTIAIAGNVGEPIACSHPGVRFVTMNEMADDFAHRSPRVR